MSSFCWACGDEVNFIWMEPGGDKRCDPCVRAKAPINPALRGKLSEMDKLGMAKPIGIESGAALILSGPGNENDKAKALHAHLAKVYGLDPCQCAVCK